MKSRIAIIVVVLAVISVGIALSDYVLKERPRQLALEPDTGTGTEIPIEDTELGIPVVTDSGSMVLSSSNSSTRIVKKGVSTKKKSGADVPAVLSALLLTPTATSEQSLLGLIHPQGTETMVLLFSNDRAGLFSWLENDDVKTIFSSLKQALQEQFSPNLKDLVDETSTPDSGPPVDILSFFDPVISPEKVIFLRVRTRLFEFHVAEKGASVIDRLILELSK